MRRLEGHKVRTFLLSGLGLAEVKKLLEAKELPEMRDSDVNELITRYSGNPQAINLAAGQIREVHHRILTEFLQEKRTLMGDIETLLDEQFGRLTPEEKRVMYWLAIERTPVLLHELRENIVDPIQSESVPQAVRSLLGRSIIESDSSTGKFSLQPVILEYTTGQFVAHVSQELEDETFELFESHALMKAQSKEHIRSLTS